MFQWFRNSKGRLVKIIIPQESYSELSLNFNTMKPPPEEQQSQQTMEMNPNAYRSMRDHIHPPHMSTPSCIVPSIEQMIVRPYLVPLLPTFHGMESENPYSHMTVTVDIMRLKPFHLTLKDKAKIWLNSLRLRSILN